MCARSSILVLAGSLTLFALGCDSTLIQSGGTLAAPEPPDPLFVTSVEPPESRVELGPRFQCRVTFSVPLDRSSLEGGILVVDEATGEFVAGSLRVEAGAIPPREVVVWRPEPGALVPGNRFSLQIAASLESEDGASVEVSPEECDDCPTFPVVYDTVQTIPELAGDLEVLVTSCSSAEVSWDGATDGDTPTEDISYRVLLAAGGAPLDPEEFALETPRGVTRAFLEDLEPSTMYDVAVVAVDAVGNTSLPTDAARFVTPPQDRCDPIPPVFSGVMELEVDPADPQVIVARWDAGEDNETPPLDLRYNIYLALESGAQDFAVPFQSSEPGAEEMRVTDLLTNTTHYVVVRAADATGNEDANSVELTVTTPSSFRLNVKPILDQNSCNRSFCHSAPTNRGGLNLQSFEGLVTIGGATRDPPTVRPGDSENSYLLWRTDASNPNFLRNRTRMPQGRPALEPLDLEAIRRWIDQGALDN